MVFRTNDGRLVATAPTACGIETFTFDVLHIEIIFELQQHLPLAVLKLTVSFVATLTFFMLQQHLPLAVLKLQSIITKGK